MNRLRRMVENVADFLRDANGGGEPQPLPHGMVLRHSDEDPVVVEAIARSQMTRCDMCPTMVQTGRAGGFPDVLCGPCLAVENRLKDLRRRMEEDQQRREDEADRRAANRIWFYSATARDVMERYRKVIRLKRFWSGPNHRFTRYQNMWRYKADMGLLHHVPGHGWMPFNLVATEPELVYRKALRFMLRHDGATEHQLAQIEGELDALARDAGPATREAARVHGNWKLRDSQDRRQDGLVLKVKP